MVLPNLLYAAFFFFFFLTLEENVRFYGQKEMSTYFRWENAGNLIEPQKKVISP